MARSGPPPGGRDEPDVQESPIAQARSLRERGDLPGAASVLRAASERGDAAAAKHLGDQLRDSGDLDGALAAYHRGAQSGDVLSMAAEGRIRRDRGELDAALTAYRSAVTGGDLLAAVNVGDLLQEQGDIAGAETAYQQAAVRGDSTAAGRLEQLRRRRGTDVTADASDDIEPSDQPAEQTIPPGQITFASSITADLPAGEDLLGFSALVQALKALLNDDQTVLPLAIAITAPWGAGKSSVMLQLKTALERRENDAGSGRKWATVLFDAWKYERSERLWAALAKAIYEQPQAQMTPFAKLRFRARLELRRLGWWKFLGITLWPSLVAAAAVLVAVNVHLSQTGNAVKWVSLSAAGVAIATQYGTLISNPFKRAIERHSKRPDYEAQLGFTAEADHDIAMLTKLLAPDEQHGLAVFVDDLDRCGSAHVVEIVEAMNQIFNAASDHRCVFVLGLDRDVVATNIGVAYADTVAQLKRDKNPLGDSFGREFLTKLVQLSVTIPQPSHEALEALMERVTGSTLGSKRTVPESEIREVQAEIRKASDDTLAGVADAAASVAGEGGAPRPALAEATRRERAVRIEDSREVAEAEFAALGYLPRNPRQVKRFHNAFRLQLHVANQDDRVPFDFTAEQLIALARWVAVRLRWAELGDAIARDPQLLLMLEASANAEPWAHDWPARADHEEFIRWSSTQDVLAVVKDAEKGRRLSAIELKTFLRIA